jgi:hypothetical protein
MSAKLRELTECSGVQPSKMLCQKETLFKSPDDEHCVLETCRELKK